MSDPLLPTDEAYRNPRGRDGRRNRVPELKLKIKTGLFGFLELSVCNRTDRDIPLQFRSAEAFALQSHG